MAVVAVAVPTPLISAILCSMQNERELFYDCYSTSVIPFYNFAAVYLWSHFAVVLSSEWKGSQSSVC